MSSFYEEYEFCVKGTIEVSMPEGVQVITGCETCFITHLCINFISTLNIHKKHIINLKFI